MHRNTEYIDAVKVYEKDLPKPLNNEDLDKKCDFFIKICDIYGDIPTHKNEKILDFGCATGLFCSSLRHKGFDAYGADILAYWAEDRELNGEQVPDVDPDTKSHLFKINPENNHLPFEDEMFDAVFSDQTFEHVFDYQPVFEEQFRVLKKGGIAVHRFPHGHNIVEPHTKIPFTPLTKYNTYLWIWAQLGKKNRRQKHMSNHEVYISNTNLIKSTNYVHKNIIMRLAKNAGFEGEFIDALDINTNRASRILKAFQKYHAGFLVHSALAYMQNCYTMILHKAAD